MKSLKTLLKYGKWSIVLGIVITALIASLIIGFLEVQSYQQLTGIDLHMGLLFDSLIVIYAFTFITMLVSIHDYYGHKLHRRQVLILQPGKLPSGYRLLCGSGTKRDDNKAKTKHPTDFLTDLDDVEDEQRAMTFIVKARHDVNVNDEKVKKKLSQLIKAGDVADRTWASYKKLIDSYKDPGDKEGLHYTFVELDKSTPFRWSTAEAGKPESATYNETLIVLLVMRLSYNMTFPFLDEGKVQYGIFTYTHGIVERARFVPLERTILNNIPKLLITGASGYDIMMVNEMNAAARSKTTQAKA